MFTLISIIVTILALAQLWFIINVRGWVLVKLLLPIVTVYLTIAIFFVFPTIMGYPTHESLPEEGTLAAVELGEDSVYLLIYTQKSSERGYWIDPRYVFSFKNDSNEPRLYRHKVDPSEQNEFRDAKQALKMGKIVKIKGPPGKGKGKGKGQKGEGKDGDTKGGVRGQGTELMDKPQIIFQDPREEQKQ